MPPEDYKIDYKTEYENQLKYIKSLKEINKDLNEQYESQGKEHLKAIMENEKLKTIITKLLEEKYCKDGD